MDVILEYQSPAFPPQNSTFNEVAAHRIGFAFAPDQGANPYMFARAFIHNRTGIPWVGFRISLDGADFAGWNPSDVIQATSDNPMVDVGTGALGLSGLSSEFIGFEPLTFTDVSPLGSSITRFNDLGSGFQDSELIFMFDQPLPAELLHDSFALHYNIIPSPGAGGANPFTATFTPIPIPEPATLGLVGLGLLATLRRRRGRIG